MGFGKIKTFIYYAAKTAFKTIRINEYTPFWWIIFYFKDLMSITTINQMSSFEENWIKSVSLDACKYHVTKILDDSKIMLFFFFSLDLCNLSESFKSPSLLLDFWSHSEKKEI